MRGTGRTKAMVMALPEGGACVITHGAEVRRYIERMIYDLRGRDFLRSCKVCVIYGHSDLGRLQGLLMPTFIDHAFWFLCRSGAVVNEVACIVDRINDRFPHVSLENKSINR